MKLDKDLTQKVIDCQSWIELKNVIKDQKIFISYSENVPKEWTAEKITTNMELVKSGFPLNLITRTNGLRAKVAELILANNYGDPWEI